MMESLNWIRFNILFRKYRDQVAHRLDSQHIEAVKIKWPQQERDNLLIDTTRIVNLIYQAIEVKRKVKTQNSLENQAIDKRKRAQKVVVTNTAMQVFLRIQLNVL